MKRYTVKYDLEVKEDKYGEWCKYEDVQNVLDLVSDVVKAIQDEIEYMHRKTGKPPPWKGGVSEKNN